jgi:hypothetical protein
VSCPRSSPHLAANGADKQATENKSPWRDPEVAALTANFGIRTLASCARNGQALMMGCDSLRSSPGSAAVAAPKSVRIELSKAEREELDARLRRRKVARGDALRAEIVLLAADGLGNLAITERLGVARATAALWRGRSARSASTDCSTSPALARHGR